MEAEVMKPVKAWAIVRAWDCDEIPFLLPDLNPLIFRKRAEALRHNRNQCWNDNGKHCTCWLMAEKPCCFCGEKQKEKANG
jgi:hypothetical protein